MTHYWTGKNSLDLKEPANLSANTTLPSLHITWLESWLHMDYVQDSKLAVIDYWSCSQACGGLKSNIH